MGKHLLFLLLAAVVLVSGCVSYGSQPTQQPPANQSPPAVNAIRILAYEFSPQIIKVKPGTTVTWTNTDPVSHTVTSDSGAFEQGQLSAGGSFSRDFSQAGTFDYHCSIHPSMKGRIIVE